MNVNGESAAIDFYRRAEQLDPNVFGHIREHRILPAQPTFGGQFKAAQDAKAIEDTTADLANLNIANLDLQDDIRAGRHFITCVRHRTTGKSRTMLDDMPTEVIERIVWSVLGAGLDFGSVGRLGKDNEIASFE